jgi:hypothetical protein
MDTCGGRGGRPRTRSRRSRPSPSASASVAAAASFPSSPRPRSSSQYLVSFRKGTGLDTAPTGRMRATAAPTTGWRRAVDGRRGVWQLGEGIGEAEKSEQGDGNNHAPRPRPCPNETKRPRPGRRHTRDSITTSLGPAQAHLSPKRGGSRQHRLAASVSPFHSTATSAGSVKSVAREGRPASARRLLPSLQISARVHPADFHFQHDGGEELRSGEVNPTRRLAPVARCAGKIQAEI